MKKICFVTTISLTLKMFILDLAKYLYETGEFDITFICSHDDSFRNDLPDYIRYVPIKMERGISLGGISACISMYKFFKKEKFDLVQFSTPNASLYASLASKLSKVPVRLYCQWGILYVGFSGLKRKIFKIVEKTVCNLSTWIEPDSYGNLRFSHLEGLYKANKSSVVWNGSASGVNLCKFNHNNKSLWRSEVRGRYDLHEDAFVFGFVGRITRDKGVNELLRSMKKLLSNSHDVYLLIIGSDDNITSIEEDIYNWSKENKRIIYCGKTNHVEQFLSTMDVLVLPSYREGFGSVVIEAGAMKVPSLVSDIPGPSDIVSPGETGFVVRKKDTEDLTRQMAHILGDSELVKRMGNQAYKYVVSNFEQKELFKHIAQNRLKLIENR